MKRMTLCAALLLPSSAFAQGTSERTIQVTGTGVVRTDPDVALLDIYLRGEGATPDDATRALATKQRAVTDGLNGLLGRGSEATASNVTVIEARGEACADARGYASRPRLSTGECAVIGYIATMQLALRTAAVAKAGTAAGLASRLGASDARLQSFALSDPQAAQARATTAAIAAARQQAEAVAKGAGVGLGPIMSMRDSANIEVTGARVGANAMAAPPPPPPPAPPVEIDVKPRPIETRAQVYVTFAIAP